MRFLIFCCVLLLSTCVLSACASATSPPNDAQDSSVLPLDKRTPGEKLRPNMTRQQCQQAGGIEIGDIGDGRIHRPDYLCENGKPPIATIISAEGEPSAIEGSVCCSPVK